jgi:hypothetical protein
MHMVKGKLENSHSKCKKKLQLESHSLESEKIKSLNLEVKNTKLRG